MVSGLKYLFYLEGLRVEVVCPEEEKASGRPY